MLWHGYYVYLDSIDLAAITHVKWVHYEQEYDCFKHGLTGISEDEHHQQKLGTYQDQEVRDRNSKYNEPDYQNNDADEDAQHIVKFIDGCFCVIER